eukprot:symbB.v1.2.007146.t1/scaffold435.1/size205859/21
MSESNGQLAPPAVLQVLRCALATLCTAESLPVRLLCRDALGMVGVLKQIILKSDELLIIAADPLNECTVASVASNFPPEVELADASEESLQPLRGVMLRCLILLRRLVVKLSEVDDEGVRVAVENLRRLDSAITKGRLATLHSFAERVRATTAEVFLVNMPLLSRILSDFESELIRINVAEIEYARFCLPNLGGSVVSLELVLTVEHGGNEIMCRPNRRWIWAELGLMEDGIELWSVQRLRLEAHSPKKDVRQVLFRQRFVCGDAAAKFLAAMDHGRSLQVALRADWPVMARVPLHLKACEVCLHYLA